MVETKFSHILFCKTLQDFNVYFSDRTYNFITITETWLRKDIIIIFDNDPARTYTADREWTESGPRAGRERTKSGPRADRERAESGPRAGREWAESGPRAGRQRADSGKLNGPTSASACGPMYVLSILSTSGR